MSNVQHPASDDEIAEIVRKANSDISSIEIVGGGTRLGLGNPVHADMQLSTSGLSGITLYEPGALTIVAKSGTPLAEIEEALAKEGQHLPFEPADYRSLMGSAGEPTIGGIVACGISGPKRFQGGACRDCLIGVRFINGTGDIVKNGGRVMKNVTGYDLVKLMAGSFGTLGILSEVSFKVLPLAEKSTTIAVEGLSHTDAIAALAKAATSPFDPTGLAHLPAGDDEAQTLVRLEGFGNQLEYRAERISELLQSFGAINRLDEKRHLNIWQQVRECRKFAGRTGSVWRISVKPSDADGFLNRILNDACLEYFLDWAGGLIWVFAEDETLDTNGGSAGVTTLLRHGLSGIGGHVTLVRAADKGDVASSFQPEAPGVAALSAAIKQQFDPANILNPGRMSASQVEAS
ncbi:MAG: FAD-binding protein [Rhizobiaceae bacterium]